MPRKNKEERKAYQRDWHRNRTEEQRRATAEKQRLRYASMTAEQWKVRQQQDRARSVKAWASLTVEQRAKQYEKIVRWRVANPRAYKNIKLKRTYGITIEQWEAMFETQDFRCACCRSDDPKSKKGWQTDHCHETKKIRGILCAPCNRALGHSKEDPARLQALIKYLETHPGEKGYANNMERDSEKRKRDYRKVSEQPFASHSRGRGAGYRFYGPFVGASAGLVC
jgi:hypothetical protein